MADISMPLLNGLDALRQANSARFEVYFPNRQPRSNASDTSLPAGSFWLQRSARRSPATPTSHRVSPNEVLQNLMSRPELLAGSN